MQHFLTDVYVGRIYINVLKNSTQCFLQNDVRAHCTFYCVRSICLLTIRLIFFDDQEVMF